MDLIFIYLEKELLQRQVVVLLFFLNVSYKKFFKLQKKKFFPKNDSFMEKKEM